jgi:hypothetical protein
MHQTHDDLPPHIKKYAPWTWKRAELAALAWLLFLINIFAWGMVEMFRPHI